MVLESPSAQGALIGLGAAFLAVGILFGIRNRVSISKDDLSLSAGPLAVLLGAVGFLIVCGFRGVRKKLGECFQGGREDMKGKHERIWPCVLVVSLLSLGAISFDAMGHWYDLYYVLLPTWFEIPLIFSLIALAALGLSKLGHPNDRKMAGSVGNTPERDKNNV
jgi:hypothetical protein